jgi:hypothetical protein
MNLSRLLIALPVAVGSLAVAVVKLREARRVRKERRALLATGVIDVSAIVGSGYLRAGFYVLLAIVLVLLAFDVQRQVLLLVGVRLAACFVGAVILGAISWRS